MGGGHPWSLVTADLEALLTALYVLINDHVIPSGERGPARPKKLSGAELACGVRLNGPSLPLDIGYSETIPAAIRNAVVLRDRHCQWAGRCDQP